MHVKGDFEEMILKFKAQVHLEMFQKGRESFTSTLSNTIIDHHLPTKASKDETIEQYLITLQDGCY